MSDLASIVPVSTVDVATASGWVRLDLTPDQLRQAASTLLDELRRVDGGAVVALGRAS